MRKMTKGFSLLLATSVIMAACGNSGNDSNAGNSPGNDGASPSAGQKVTLSAWAWNVNVGALNDAIEMYKQSHPNVELKVEDIGRLDVYDKLSTGLAAGGQGLPDIVLVEDDRIQGYLDAFPNGFLNLSDKGFEGEEFPAFKQELASYAGSFYAFPFDAGPTGVFYRTDIFEEAGVRADDIETWDDYIEAGKAIKEKTGSYMLPIDKFKDDANFRMMLNQLGVYYFDQEGNIDFNDPKSVQAMDMIKKMGDADLVKDVNGWDGTVSATVDGSVATVPFGAWYYGTIIDQAKDTEGRWGVFELPAFEEGGNRAANLGGSSWMIPASTKHADEAYGFLNFFSTTAEVQQIAMEKHGLFPSLLSAFELPVFQSEVAFFGGQKIWQLFADEMSRIPTPYYTKDYAIAMDEAVKAQAEVFNGKEAADALKASADRLKDRTQRNVNGG